jgi:hypothetical protein
LSAVDRRRLQVFLAKLVPASSCVIDDQREERAVTNRKMKGGSLLRGCTPRHTLSRSKTCNRK